jgi:hypothetical protein
MSRDGTAGTPHLEDVELFIVKVIRQRESEYRLSAARWEIELLRSLVISCRKIVCTGMTQLPHSFRPPDCHARTRLNVPRPRC